MMNGKGVMGHPIRAFYTNMLKIGLKFRVKDGQLRVGGNKEVLTPVLQTEIEKRAEHLVEMLTPPPSPDMAGYFGRLLILDELIVALKEAERLGERVDSFPVSGGWLLVTSKVHP